MYVSMYVISNGMQSTPECNAFNWIKTGFDCCFVWMKAKEKKERYIAKGISFIYSECIFRNDVKNKRERDGRKKRLKIKSVHVHKTIGE